jgi:hypothetical protein
MQRKPTSPSPFSRTARLFLFAKHRANSRRLLSARLKRQNSRPQRTAGHWTALYSVFCAAAYGRAIRSGGAARLCAVGTVSISGTLDFPSARKDGSAFPSSIAQSLEISLSHRETVSLSLERADGLSQARCAYAQQSSARKGESGLVPRSRWLHSVFPRRARSCRPPTLSPERRRSRVRFV